MEPRSARPWQNVVRAGRPRSTAVFAAGDLQATVRRPLPEMAAMSAGPLLRLIDGEDVNLPRVALATSLVVRDSTAPPPR